MGDSIQIQLPLIDNQFYLSEDTIVGEKIGVTDLTNEFSKYSNQLFKTESGAYIIDSSNLSANDNPVSPVLLVKENTSRGVTTTNLYDINYTPNAIVDNKEQYQIFYENKSKWSQDVFSKDGLFQYTNSINLSELLNHEANYNLDINGDSSIGDKITSVLFIDKVNNNGLYKTVSGAFIADVSSLSVGDFTSEPLIFINQSSNGTSSLHSFKFDPTGALSFKDGSGVGVYYQDSGGAWKRDNFDNGWALPDNGFVND